MDTANLQIKVTGDVKQLQSALLSGGVAIKDFSGVADKSLKGIGFAFEGAAKSASTSLFVIKEKLAQLKGALFTETDINKIRVFNTEIKALEGQVKSLQATSGNAGAFSGITTGAGNAFSAVRKLAYILPGVGIAGIIGFATEPIIKYVATLFEASAATKKLQEQEKFLLDFNKEIADNYGKESASLKVLRAEIESATVPMATRLQAIKDLKKEFPGYFEGLSNEQLLTGNVAAAYDLATAAILRRAKATAATAEIEKIEARKLDILLKSQLAAIKANEDIKNATGTQGFESESGASRGLTNSTVQSQRNLQKQVIADRFNLQKAADQDELSELAKKESFLLQFAVAGADAVIKIEKDKVAKIRDINKRSVTDVLSDLRQQIALLNKEELTFNTDKSKDRVSAFLAAIKELVVKFNLDPDGKLIQGLFNESKIAKLGYTVNNGFLKLGVGAAKALREGIDTQLASDPVVIPISFKQAALEISTSVFPNKGQTDAQLDDYSSAIHDGLVLRLKAIHIPFNPLDSNEGLQKTLDDATAKLAAFVKGADEITSGIVQNLAVSVGEALGNALTSATGGIGNFFGGILKALGAGLKQLGAYFIKTAIEIKIFKEFITKYPVAAIAAGIALVALGSVITAQVNKTPAFAAGVRNFRGGLAIVGERGPELVNLPNGSDVIPNHQLGSLSGEVREVPYVVSYTLAGQDLRAVLKRADGVYNTNT